MKKTAKYDLNLIELSDTFSPAPINENTEKIATQFDTVRAEAATANTAVDQRLQALESHRFAVGSYSGDNTAHVFSLGFTPRFVIVNASSGGGSNMAIGGSSSTPSLSIVSGGFSITGADSTNSSSRHYCYIAYA